MAIVIENIIISLAIENDKKKKKLSHSLDILTQYNCVNSLEGIKYDNSEKQLDGSADVDNVNENCVDERSLARSARSLRFTTFAKI